MMLKIIGREKVALEKLKTRIEKIRERPLLILYFNSGEAITHDCYCEIYNHLRKNFVDINELDVFINCLGGEIDIAYQLGKTLNDFAPEYLSFIIPRFAKSAASLLAMSGDEIIMGTPSEIGPLDAQIYDSESGETFSPLSLPTALSLIKEDGYNYNHAMVDLFANKSPSLMMMGEFIKCLEVSERYVFDILSTRMLRNKPLSYIGEISHKLVRDYPHHGYCINFSEAEKIGLVVRRANSQEWEAIWNLYLYLYNIERKRNRHMNRT